MTDSITVTKNLENPCPFCTLPAGRVVEENELALLILDGYPVSPGHSLIIPKRHFGSFFSATAPERSALLSLLDKAKELAEIDNKPAGYNIGINDGAAAGQTVPHLHIHLIPRYEGDQDDPRGGVRWVIPNKANYWSQR
ncbi:HIT family protein [Massilia glaciei]|uniref:HIT family protein n=1 Tax=Massilia glaciei TaxID=1524097 RepID=A0A2U2HPP9_9BURK|nr:HIT family protein [Massilia glaciei]PWF49426.1 HIT family protein [Massilia glaciei]